MRIQKGRAGHRLILGIDVKAHKEKRHQGLQGTSSNLGIRIGCLGGAFPLLTSDSDQG